MINIKSKNLFYNKHIFLKFYNDRAFTLAEILAAVVLISIVTGAIYSFYEIGARTHRNYIARSESISAFRFLQKLLIDKLERKSEDIFSAFMKKNGFTAITQAEINEIIRAPYPRNEALYRAAGYNSYSLHQALNVESIDVSKLKKRFEQAQNFDESIYGGPYLYEATIETELTGPENYRISFERSPAGIIAASFLSGDNSTILNSNLSDDTLELNAGIFKNAGVLINAPSVSDVSFFIQANVNNRINLNVFNAFFFFNSNYPPGVTLSQNLEETSIKKYFIESACLYCDDGILFYEHDTLENYTAHAIYLETPADGGQAEYDENGVALKNIRYAFSRTTTNEVMAYNDILIKNVMNFKISYYDKNSKLIDFDNAEWKWHYAPFISSIALETVIYKDGIIDPIKMIFSIDKSY